MLRQIRVSLTAFALVALLSPVVASAGVVDGPVADSDRVEANSSVRYTFIFRGCEAAAVAVSGDGDTDLDLYIYDEDGSPMTLNDIGSS